MGAASGPASAAVPDWMAGSQSWGRKSTMNWSSKDGGRDDVKAAAKAQRKLDSEMTVVQGKEAVLDAFAAGTKKKKGKKKIGFVALSKKARLKEDSKIARAYKARMHAVKRNKKNAEISRVRSRLKKKELEIKKLEHQATVKQMRREKTTWLELRKKQNAFKTSTWLKGAASKVVPLTAEAERAQRKNKRLLHGHDADIPIEDDIGLSLRDDNLMQLERAEVLQFHNMFTELEEVIKNFPRTQPLTEKEKQVKREMEARQRRTGSIVGR